MRFGDWISDVCSSDLKLGEAQAIAPATTDWQPSDPQIAFHLARFIEQVRSIPADAIVVRENWLRAYDFTSPQGALDLNAYARANAPFAQIGTAPDGVDVSSVIRASNTHCRIAWVEPRLQGGRLTHTTHGSAPGTGRVTTTQ